MQFCSSYLTLANSMAVPRMPHPYTHGIVGGRAQLQSALAWARGLTMVVHEAMDAAVELVE